MADINWGDLATDLLGTSEGVVRLSESVVERHGIEGIDYDEIAEHLTDHGIEQCDECGTWVETGEIVLDEESQEVLGCDACYVEKE